MDTNVTSGEPTTESTETGDQDNQTTGQEPTASETQQVTDSGSTETDSADGQAEGESTTSGSQEKDPAKESLLADLRKERDRRQALQAEVDQLKADTTAATQVKDELTAVQAKYDRLESFLSAVGGPISKALDSRSFTEKLFGTDTEIDQLVSDWHKSNPSAVSSALAGSANPATGAPSINDLLRAAAK